MLTRLRTVSLHRRQPLLLIVCVLLSLLILAGCSGGGTANGAATSGSSAGSGGANAGTSSGAPSTQPQSPNNQNIAQYLVKTLKVTMAVSDTTKVADALQSWIAKTDPRSSSAGIDYEQTSNNLYNVSLSFSVQSTIYPQIEHYLRDYASQNGGQLLSLTETVQNVSNDYIDTQSQLTNLRAEQTRLLDLLSHAQALSDILTIEDKLTTVEGQIETIEEHLKALQGQVAYYTVSISLQPLDTSAPAPTNTPGWSIGQTFHNAFVSSLGFAQAVATFFIWLFAYIIYIIPVAVIIWFIYRRRVRYARASKPQAPRT